MVVKTPATTPPSRPDDLTTLKHRLAVTNPADLVVMIGNSTVASPLFPAEVGALQIAPWQDDADVEGAHGAFQVLGSGAYLIIGAYVVYPDAAFAATILAHHASSAVGAGRSTVVGLSSTSFIGTFGPVTLVQVGPVLVWGFGMPPRSASDAKAGALQDLTRLQLQAMTFALALLDHLNETRRAGDKERS